MHDSAIRSSTSYLTRAVRVLRLGLHFALGIYLAAAVYPRRSGVRQQAMIQHWSKRLLVILNIQLRCYDQPPTLPAKSLLLANHVSWIDIFAICAVFPATFVAKAEIRRWPLLGKVCERTGTIFVERGSSRGARRANREIARALNEGMRPVVVYPEGTTTLGADLKPFRPALLQSAVDAAALVHPLALRYVDNRGARAEAAAWVGDATLLGSIFTLVRQPELALELRFLGAWSASNHTRGEIAVRAQTVIARALGIGCYAADAAYAEAA